MDLQPHAPYEWYHAIAYPLILVNALVGIAGLERPFDFNSFTFSSTTFVSTAILAGFLIAGMGLWVTGIAPRILATLVHHVVSGSAYIICTITGWLPVAFVWIPLVQATGCAFHPMRLAALADPPRPRLRARLEQLHALLFFALRLVGGGLLIVTSIIDDHADPMVEGVLWKVGLYVLAVTYFGLHIAWLKYLVAALRNLSVEAAAQGATGA